MPGVDGNCSGNELVVCSEATEVLGVKCQLIFESFRETGYCGVSGRLHCLRVSE